MDVKQLSTISNLPWGERIAVISDGLQAIWRNVASLRGTLELLKRASDWRGYSLVQTFAEEEAAKYLILLDYVRYPNSKKALADRYLKYFYSHFVRLLYSELCKIRPATWDEILDWLEIQRASDFLDGPNDVDWMFRNEILQNREGALYVDYVQMDGEWFWITPSDRELETLGIVGITGSPVLHLVERLEDAGFTSICALNEIQDTWSAVGMEPGTHWQEIRAKNIETLKRVDTCREPIDEELSDLNAKGIVDNWSFPLHGVDLEMFKVNRKELEEYRQNYRGWDW